MARDVTLADGQLAASAGTILAGSSLPSGVNGFIVQGIFQNTAATAETVVITMQRAGGTARRIARAVLAQNEQLIVRGLGMQPDDTLLGTTTNASAVDYMITASGGGPFEIITLGAAGAQKAVRSEVSRTVQIATRGKIGGTAGWAVAAADNLPYLGTVPQSQSGSTFVLPVDGLAIGDTITGFRVVAQIESAGGAVTLDAALRATTNVAAEPTDASIGAITQISVTADTAASQAKTGLTEVVTSGKTYYILLTATTAASTDIILQACEITYTTS